MSTRRCAASRTASRRTAWRPPGESTCNRRRSAALDIDSAVIDGDYRDSTGVIRTLDVKGRDVNLTATGTVALNETGQSNLKVHADTTSLDEIGKLVDQPLNGIATVDATVTGNRRELQATGNLMATTSHTATPGR